MSAPPTSALNEFPWRRSLLNGVVLGTAFGVIFRLIIGSPHFKQGGLGRPGLIVSLAFLLLGPLYTGFVTIQIAERRFPRSALTWIIAPWLPILLSALVLWVCFIENIICIVMALPIMLVCASIGGVIAGLLARHGRRLSPSALGSLALLPVLIAPAESLRLTPTQTRMVESQILIHASADTVWHNIERVPAISPTELRPTWTQRIGFPRPLEATLSYEGVGGVRHATFEHGLTFIETISTWQPDRLLAFGISADSAHIPTTTLDEHVTIGGPYFDVLDGEYRLEPLPDGKILLHLTSHQRLSTDLNGYAGLWTDAVMQTLQTSILQVIQHRCEFHAGPSAQPPSVSP